MTKSSELDNNIYTKKGTLRKRKPKKNKNYFTQDTEDAILQYVASTDQEERNKIYRERIHYAFTKLTENLIHTYKYYYTDNYSIEELQHNAIIFLIERLGKFKAGKGKAYSYFGTIAKRYFILNNKYNYDKLKSHSDIDNINDESDVDKELIIHESTEEDLINFFDIYIKYNEMYLERLYPKELDKKIANAILELFRKRENLDIFNKKAFYIFIKEQVDADTPAITKIIKRMKDIYKELYNQYSKNGFIEKL
jgi:hypothetical protein